MEINHGQSYKFQLQTCEYLQLLGLFDYEPPAELLWSTRWYNSRENICKRGTTQIPD